MIVKIYLILLGLIFFNLGCATKKPEAIKEQVKTISSPKLEPKSSFHKENIINEDANTKVFRNCFKTGKVTLEKSCKKGIDTFLKVRPLKYKRNIVIEVHTDKGGSQKKNLAISIKRAKTTAGSLYYKEYKNSKVYYKGFGESKLIYDEQTKKANIANRRIVIKLRDKGFHVDKKSYNFFVKTKTNKNKKIAIKKVQKREKPKLSTFTGEADTGWMYFGKASLAKKFTLTCSQDKPLKVKHKAISRAEKNEFLSTFYNRKISLVFNDTKMEVYPIYIYENGKLPIGNPILSLTEKEKTLRFQTTVNTYRGKKGILYRIFVNGKKRVSCVDLVISDKDDKVSFGRVYMQDGKEFELKP